MGMRDDNIFDVTGEIPADSRVLFIGFRIAALVVLLAAILASL